MKQDCRCHREFNVIATIKFVADANGASPGHLRLRQIGTRRMKSYAGAPIAALPAIVARRIQSIGLSVSSSGCALTNPKLV
jgi:hypothetical protein